MNLIYRKNSAASLGIAISKLFGGIISNNTVWLLWDGDLNSNAHASLAKALRLNFMSVEVSVYWRTVVSRKFMLVEIVAYRWTNCVCTLEMSELLLEGC